MYKNFQHFLNFYVKNKHFLSFYHQQMLVQRPTSILISSYKLILRLYHKQGRNQLGGRGGRPPPVKSWAPSKMWLFIVIARRKCEKRVLSLAQYYTILTIILQ